MFFPCCQFCLPLFRVVLMNASSNPNPSPSGAETPAAETSGDAKRPSTGEVSTGEVSTRGGSTGGGLFDERPVPRLGAEHSFEAVADQQVPSLRWTGIAAVFFGCISFTAVVAWQMLVIPVVAIVLGVIALRPHRGPKPVGTRPAVLGLMLACGFGACGLMLPWLKHNYMASEAVHFSRQFLQLVSAGDLPFVMEMHRSPNQRQMPETDLDDYYQRLDRTSFDRSIAGFADFVQQTEAGAFSEIRQYGDSLEWELARPPEFYQKYSTERALTVWRDRSGKLDREVVIELLWHPGEDDQAQWSVKQFEFVRS